MAYIIFRYNFSIDYFCVEYANAYINSLKDIGATKLKLTITISF